MSTDTSLAQYLTFTAGEEVFAMDISKIREIIQHASMTVVPLMPECVRGVINLRGAVVPVIDLQSRFRRTTTKVGSKTCVVIFDVGPEGDKSELGLMVDAVSEVIEIHASDIEPTPAFGTTIEREFIRGMGRVGEDFIAILEPERVLSVDEMAELAKETNAAAAA